MVGADVVDIFTAAAVVDAFRHNSPEVTLGQQ